MPAPGSGVFQQALGLNGSDGFQSSPHGQRVSAEGRAVVTRLKDVGGRPVGNDSADGHTRAEAFGKRHDIGDDIGPLVGEPLARSSNSALDLIEHEQPFFLCAQLAQGLKKFDL